MVVNRVPQVLLQKSAMAFSLSFSASLVIFLTSLSFLTKLVTLLRHVSSAGHGLQSAGAPAMGLELTSSMLVIGAVSLMMLEFLLSSIRVSFTGFAVSMTRQGSQPRAAA